jgi:tRNA(Ile)-lysidine synthase TilS/MesJ
MLCLAITIELVQIYTNYESVASCVKYSCQHGNTDDIKDFQVAVERWNEAAVAWRGICRYSSPAVTHELASLGSAKGVTCVAVGFSELLYVFCVLIIFILFAG